MTDSASLPTTSKMPLTITKSELRDALGCREVRRFNRVYMTDTVLGEILGLGSREVYNRIREFNVMQTRALIDFFRLGPEQFRPPTPQRK